ncbi:Hypothetical protein R9X50_00517300 [Acrodontium crateriforme]|uniref:Dienelactone hydrolase domain-containing protein n=1 Tax=Acrodontium crateriforme TaxID=150365 RepID=A0AAQ3RAP3_9PEZI|nr:Hypothetical protein R9X50_00517300 [Acrodontium crateriforme]
MSLKQCCASGSLHTGTPTGRIEKVHGLDCYIADAPNGSPKGIVVIIPDAFGWTLPNSRILADDYAKKGNFTVYLPEFMDGVVVPLQVMISFKALSATGFWNQLYKFGHFFYLLRYMVPFLIKCRPAVCRPRIDNFFRALKDNEAANLPCWGANYVTKLCWDETRTASGKRVVDVGYVAHPSSIKYPDDIEKIVLPYSCAASEHDMQMSVDNAKVCKDVLVAKTAKTKDVGIEHEFVMYHGVHHGFAVRADEDDLHEAEAGKKAEAQAISWFTRWFANPPPSLAS